MKILGHFQTTVMKALEEIEPDYLSLPGLVICGTHAPNDLPLDDFILEITEARENGTPFLGICFGHQLAAIEYAKNELGIADATSEEFGVGGTCVVVERPGGMKIGLHEGETYWSNYMIDPAFDKKWRKPPHFLTTPAHPEYQSVKGKPHPLLLDFLNLCKSK